MVGEFRGWVVEEIAKKELPRFSVVGTSEVATYHSCEPWSLQIILLPFLGSFQGLGLVGIAVPASKSGISTSKSRKAVCQLRSHKPIGRKLLLYHFETYFVNVNQ